MDAGVEEKDRCRVGAGCAVGSGGRHPGGSGPRYPALRCVVANSVTTLCDEVSRIRTRCGEAVKRGG